MYLVHTTPTDSIIHHYWENWFNTIEEAYNFTKITKGVHRIYTIVDKSINYEGREPKKTSIIRYTNTV